MGSDTKSELRISMKDAARDVLDRVLVDAEIVVETTERKRARVELDRTQVITILQYAGFEIPNKSGRVKIYMSVPGGGDWSNTDLEVEDGRFPSGGRLIVEWESDPSTKRQVLKTDLQQINEEEDGKEADEHWMGGDFPC